MKSKKLGLPSTMPKVDIQAILDDFRYMNPNDPGAWPVVPKVTILVGLFFALLLAGWWFLWSDQLSVLERSEQEELTLKDQFIAKKRQAVNLDLYTQQLAEIDRSFGALLKQLPNKSEIEALLIEVNQAGLGRGLQFELFRPGAEQIKDFYAELPVTVKINGSYHDIGTFAADIAKLPRIVTLNGVSVAPLKSSELLTLDATVKTFRYLDENEIAQQKKPEPDGSKKPVKGAAK
ncbi:pilus assembly protein PilO [Azonexus hydrophilus]|uniref:Pilus assembly protein PilO n=1 Tax=Azonexus hydrophilus TaxID=418702 RepID=A0A1R1ICE8_9RHOO|nr:type 4a pilus biogenesis protein PilO [Azonexus hydrophilus]OMG56365.1 pilus assembly protein PilO [Azonexus hydrophilus]